MTSWDILSPEYQEESVVTDNSPSKPSSLDAMMTPDDLTAAQADATRWRYGFLVVVAVSSRSWSRSAPPCSPPGSSPAALFPRGSRGGGRYQYRGLLLGVQAGQSGKARVEAELARSQEMVVRLAAYVGAQNAPRVIDEVLGRRRS